MIGLGSLKMSGQVEAEVPQLRLGRVPAFDNSVVTSTAGAGVRPDPEDGRLWLAPGSVYLVMMTASVTFAHVHAPTITLALVLAGDRRFRGPRQEVGRKNGHATLWGVITVPPGEPATLEAWALANDEYATTVTFSDGELLAVRLANSTEVNS